MKKIYIDISICGSNAGYISGAGEYGLTVFKKLKEILPASFFYVGAKKSVLFSESIFENIAEDNVLRYDDYAELNDFLEKNAIQTIFFPQLLGEFISVKSKSKIIAVLHDLGDILELENNKKDYYGKYYKLRTFNKIKFFVKSHISYFMDKIIQRKIACYKNLFQNFSDLHLVTVSHFSDSTIK